MTNGNVLKLNAAYMPLEFIHWSDAIKLIEKGKAEIVETYEDKYLNSYKTAFNMPCVIRLIHFIAPKKNMKFYLPFTRRHVYERDHGKCAYCGASISLAKMTYDHVIPKSRGGLTNWNNIVCACLKCNSKKNNRTPEEAGMKLLVRPYAPLIADNFNTGMMKKLKAAFPHVSSKEKWASYLYWNVNLEED